MRTIRLKARRRIGIKMVCAVDSKSVTSIGTGLGRAGKISSVFTCERMKGAWRIFFRARLENEIDRFCFGRPHPKMRFVFADQFCANGIMPLPKRARLSPTKRVSVVRNSDFSFHPKIDN